MSSPSVLIVGAGNAGSVLALTLLKNDISVRIVDKGGPQIGQKGMGIQPRSIEMHHFLGTLPDILKSAKSIPLGTIYKLPGGTEPLKTFNMEEYEDPTPDCPYPNLFQLGQHRQQSILHRHLQKYGCQVEFNTEVRSFEQFDTHILVTLARKDADGNDILETIDVPYLVGADGAHSTVRKALGLTFLGDTRNDVDMVIGDIEIKSGLDPKVWHIWGEASAEMVTLMPTEADDNMFTFILAGKDLGREKIASGRDELVKAVHSITNRTDIEFGDLVWISRYRPNIRMVNKFSEGRVFVTGDAAHIHSPAGGQGANSGVQDSFNLGWKLALVLKGVAQASLLDTYTEERLPVIATMLEKSTLLFNRGLARSNGDGSNWTRGKEYKQLGVNYRGSSTLVDETAPQNLILDSYNLASDGVVHAGDRAPEAPGLYNVLEGRSISLFNIFGPDHHTVLAFCSSTEGFGVLSSLNYSYKRFLKTVLVLPSESKFEPTNLPASVDLILCDRDGHAYKAYPSLPGRSTMIVVRPDGVIGAIVSGSEGLLKYLRGVMLVD
ncbi:hypothetical protein GYMLUDRAFT_36594 [Collybiopsis luxurians FD-317 M1]|nr:hypothetical protein GYMLUDRAFT_36594 [Collybiopsis luxurians FD-317 M1]